jgi:hypothetical protein
MNNCTYHNKTKEKENLLELFKLYKLNDSAIY